jgi:Ser/Thr protein kinase RdoA (MazF antagonist)
MGGPTSGPTRDSPALRTAARWGVPTLAAHLSTTYGTDITELDQLDLGVYRVDRADGESWVARVFPALRPRAHVDGDAEILRRLAELGYPAERVAVAQPVSVHEDQPVLVTRYVTPAPREQRREAVVAAGGLRALGWLLGKLHTLDGAAVTGALARPGGGWHHLADGSPQMEAQALATLVHEAVEAVAPRSRRYYDTVRAAVDELDTGDGLPTVFTHPDFVMANVVAPGDGKMVLVDWSGAGQAPRAWSLAFLLWSVGFGGDLARVDRAVDGYRRHLTPEPEELARLDTLVASRPVVFEAWAWASATGRRPPADAARGIPRIRETAAAIAARARAAFTGG